MYLAQCFSVHTASKVIVRSQFGVEINTLIYIYIFFSSFFFFTIADFLNNIMMLRFGVLRQNSFHLKNILIKSNGNYDGGGRVEINLTHIMFFFLMRTNIQQSRRDNSHKSVGKCSMNTKLA